MLNSKEQARLQELEEAFQLFNQTSVQLSHAYDALQKQVEALQLRLEASDREKREVADRLGRLLKLMPAGVIVLDEANRIIEMNPSAELILGSDAIHRDWDIVVMNAFLSRNDAGELLTHDEKVYQLADAHLDHGNGRILLIQDVTAARDLQSHVSRHQRLDSMGEMAASLAHQIRTPLASALLYVSQLNVVQLDDERRGKFVGKALNSLNHIESLIKDMLQYAKGGKGSKTPLQVDELLRQLSINLETQIKQADAELILKLPKEPLSICGDKDGLLTALQNLVVNALDVVGQGAKIEVRATQLDGARLDLVVSDNGPGIEEDRLQKIFEPFYTSRAKGTGLGLAVVRAIAEAHDGRAWVKSIPGYGSQFGIRLPIN
ncbi:MULTISPECIES: sensor histidine kinase [Thiomicrorhabdus]|uniref:histidine kinase n=1 Tax=Thiomicrorhabdus heinhorstiae TaxID=2748010 RepID=A0ABS0BX90_9GAMM|nr:MULTISPECIES: ATP-binding protein [Thiomicrorhabdus]MBF6058384.1 PAS domain-containing protein [Thiomicrorhabdus heinhorstiae]